MQKYVMVAWRLYLFFDDEEITYMICRKWTEGKTRIILHAENEDMRGRMFAEEIYKNLKLCTLLVKKIRYERAM